jgi:molybdopterin-guanine dinucleotide biosynthesis protein A
MNMSQLPTPVIIIAGGQGHRIGGSKPSRLMAGKTLLNHAIEIATGYSSWVVISASDNILSHSIGNLRVLHDADTNIGPIAGLASALNYGAENGAGHVMIISCDTPFLPSDLLKRLQSAIGVANVAVATSKGQFHATCALWRTDALQFLPDYLAQGRRSLIGFSKTAGCIAVDWPTRPFDPFFNINTPEDLVLAEQIIAQSQQ